MELSPLDIWLDTYKDALFNLGESGIQNNLVSDFLNRDGLDEFARLDFEHNDILGSPELRRAVAALYDTLDESQILITSGATEAILLYYLSTFQAGANVVVVLPTFHCLYDVPSDLGFEVRTVSMRRENKFALPLDEIKQNVDNRTSAIIVCSPNNPTGMVCTASDWKALIEIAEHVDCDIVADEEYRFLPYETASNYLPSPVDQSPRVISLSSPGKCFGCVGLRVGWMAARKEVIERCVNFKTLTTHTVFKGSDFLARKIIERHTELTSQYRTWILTNLATLNALVNAHPSAIEYVPPKAGSVAFPRIKNWPSAQAFAKELITRENVLVLPGDAFSMPDSFRLRLGVPPDHFKEAMLRMSRLLK